MIFFSTFLVTLKIKIWGNLDFFKNVKYSTNFTKSFWKYFFRFFISISGIKPLIGQWVSTFMVIFSKKQLRKGERDQILFNLEPLHLCC